MATNRALAFYIALAAAVPGCATAQTAAGAERVTVSALSDINNQNVLKAAQLQGLELDEKIKKLKPATGDDTSAGTKEPSPVAEDDSLPVVQGVYGANGQLFATLAYADGRRAIDVRKGAHVPGGYTVSELASDSVTLTRGKQRLVIGFADKATVPVVRPTGAAYTTGAGLPLGMPMGAGVPPVQ